MTPAVFQQEKPMSAPAVLDPSATKPDRPVRATQPLASGPFSEYERYQNLGRDVYRAGEWRGASWPITLPPNVSDFEVFLKWVQSEDFPAGVKASYIKGKIWLEPRMDDYAHHNLLKGAVFAALRSYGRETNLGEAFVDGAMVALPPDDPDAVGREPDCGFNLYDSFRSGRVQILPRIPGGSGLLHGQPDLLAECLSDGSVEKDTVDLRARYLEMGVREYWILDGRGDGLTFALLTRADDQDDWTEAEPDAGGYRLSPLLGRRVRVDRGTNPVGHVQWDVRLEEPAA